MVESYPELKHDEMRIKSMHIIQHKTVDKRRRNLYTSGKLSGVRTAVQRLPCEPRRVLDTPMGLAPPKDDDEEEADDDQIDGDEEGDKEKEIDVTFDEPVETNDMIPQKAKMYRGWKASWRRDRCNVILFYMKELVALNMKEL